VAFGYFLYCWQRIASKQASKQAINQAELKPAAIDKIQAALKILRSKT
jgi:hypothetical protein